MLTVQSVMMLLCSYAIKSRRTGEVVIATAPIVNCSPYALVCTECNELVIAPDRSEYMGSREVRHFWCCENCGHKTAMMVDLRIAATKRLGVRSMALVA